MSKLIAKVLPIFYYYICTGYRISSDLYGNPSDLYSRTRQDNMFLGEQYKIKSGYILKQSENK